MSDRGRGDVVREATRIDVQRLAEIASSIGALLDQHEKRFEELSAFEPDFGDFDAAVWLGEFVTGRRDAIVAHVAYLRRVSAEIQAALDRVVEEVGQTDTRNGSAVGQVAMPHRH
jgi:hypothetical protein